MSDGKNSFEIVLTGVGIGLPGPDKEIFDPNNFERLFKGESFISNLPESQIRAQKQQHIVKKLRSGGHTRIVELDKTDDLVKLAGISGKFDLINEYGVGQGLIDAWEITTQLAVAACLEALKDAYIPLVGSDETYALPMDYQASTGIIFASTFPSANTFLEEQAKYTEAKFHYRLEEIAKEVESRFGQDAADLIRSHCSGDYYNFDRKFLLKAIPIQSGNIAQIIGAHGPNTGINAACASTTQAIAMAEDWIKLGRCERVVVVAADDPTNEVTFGWIGSGFLAAGAANTGEEVDHAAKPFDKSRSGMILGMGAVAIVVEALDSVRRRGVKPIAMLLGSRFVNSAFHGTRMDPIHVSSTFKSFMEEMENQYGIDRGQIALNCLYLSHETYTPPQGNAARTEIEALKNYFESDISKVTIANTKGLTGHPMGVSFEDVVAVKCMELGRVPPVANLLDPEFEDINFAIGGDLEIDHCIRFAAGFGSQVVYLLFKNLKVTERLTERHQEWLSEQGIDGCLEKRGKTLVYSLQNT